MNPFTKIFCLLAVTSILQFRLCAQTPVINSQVGFPVGIRPAIQAAYGNSKYVLLEGYNYSGNSNAVYQSADASGWSKVTTSGLTSVQLNHMAFGAGVFVVTGNSGIIQTSTDGISWITRTSGTANNLYKVYFLNSNFFAVGQNRTLLKSADGITWTAVTFSAGIATDMLMGLTYGNGVYVITARTGGGGGGHVYRSTTATNNSWTYYANTPAFETVNRIQFLNNKFFCFNAGNNMYTSSDGISWTNITPSVVLTNPNGSTTAWNASHQIFNGVWDGTTYRFYGSSAYYSGYGSNFTSTDGVNFTLLTKTAYIVPQESTIINGIYFVTGNEGVVTSADGITYQHPGSSLRDMVKTGTKYVSVGMVSQDGQIFNSPDFTNWTNRTPAGTKELYATAYDGTSVLAAGFQKVFSSATNGDTWTTAYTHASETITAMAYGNGRFVAGGYSDITGSFLRYSTNGGASWTDAASDPNYYFKIKYINNRFFAFAADNDTYTGRIMYSTDGISWTDVTPNLGYEVLYYKDVAFDGTKYHFFGVESNAWVPIGFFTVSTTTPQTPGSYTDKAVISNTPVGAILGGTWDEGVLDYSGGKFTGAVIDATTGQDYIIYSTNGSSWTAVPQVSTSSITAAYPNGNSVQMIGRGNAFFTVTHSSTLPVALMQFSGRFEEPVVKLNWTTASEVNSKQFIIQHSADGINWREAGIVAAAGNSSLSTQYNFIHNDPAQGVNFYRLIQQDIDGRSAQSRVINVTTTGVQKIEWYPNPAADKVTIRTATALPGQIILFNSSGQAVKRVHISSYETVIDVSLLPAGSYYADIIQGQSRERVSMIKK
jgi:hypothetical protein